MRRNEAITSSRIGAASTGLAMVITYHDATEGTGTRVRDVGEVRLTDGEAWVHHVGARVGLPEATGAR